MSDDYPRFLAEDFPVMDADACRFHIFPCPLERTVSYGGGAAAGPRAILEASIELEAWMEDGIPGRHGIHVHPPIDCSVPETRAILDDLGERVADAVEAGVIPISLGGEHAITMGPIEALHRRGRRFGVVQIDAHADLRDRYEGSRLSHACVMHRVLDCKIPMFQLGIRSLSAPEAQLRIDHQIPYIDARELMTQGIPDRILPDDFPDEVYLTFDLDAYDASLMPSTGTPEPGGLFWYEALGLMEKICAERRVIAADFVELAPQAGRHAPDFVAAKTVYAFMKCLGN
ncbi:MAG: agmatinase [Kiritimatiellia bacterium]|jgi:agmatinase